MSRRDFAANIAPNLRQYTTPNLRWHLTSNVYPPVPEVMHPAAEAAIDACVDGEPDRPVPLPTGVYTRAGAAEVPAHELVAAYRLEWFVDDALAFQERHRAVIDSIPDL